MIHTDIIGYKHICTDMDIWDWTLKLDWTHMYRYWQICTDIDRYAQLLTATKGTVLAYW